LEVSEGFALRTIYEQGEDGQKKGGDKERKQRVGVVQEWEERARELE